MCPIRIESFNWLLSCVGSCERIGVDVFGFAGDPGSARVPRALRSEGAMINSNQNSILQAYFLNSMLGFGVKIGGSSQ